MLDYLVTSKARRRLLRLMIGEGVSGSAGELARRAYVGFASAHRELQAMRTRGLVSSAREGRAEVYRASDGHPLAAALRSLILAPTGAKDAAADARTRCELISLGAPLYGTPVPVASVEDALARGAGLAHRDSTVAAVLPICLYRQRDALDPRALAHCARGHGERQAIGFFLDLTSSLSKDRRFARWAEPLRDRRRTGATWFFVAESGAPDSREVAERNTPRIARNWGLRMNMGIDAFATTFDKHARA